MKRSPALFTLSIAAATLLAILGDAYAQQAAAFRRFTTKDGKAFSAAVVKKDNASVTLKFANGGATVLPIRQLSEPDQQFVRKWTKFKDDLLNSAEFATLSVKDMLELRGYQSFEFDIEGNHIFVEGQLNGKDMKFLVDTGAQSSLVHLSSAQDAGLEIGPMDQTIYGIGGKVQAAVTKAPSIKLGDAVIENRRLLTTDIFKNIPGGKGYDAIFGADFLRELDAVISYREGRMFLKPDNVLLKTTAPGAPVPGKPETRSEFRRWTTKEGQTFVAAIANKDEKQVHFRTQNGKVAPLDRERLTEEDLHIVDGWSKFRDELAKSPEWRTLTVKELLELRGYQSFEYRLSGNHIIVDGMVGSTKGAFLIDTGAHGAVFHLEFAKAAGCEVGPMDQTIYGIAGPAPAAITKLASLKIGDVVIEKREVVSADLFKDMPVVGGKGDHDAIFGAEFMRELDAVISYKEARMFLKPDNSDRAAQAAADTEKKDGAAGAAGEEKKATQ